MTIDARMRCWSKVPLTNADPLSASNREFNMDFSWFVYHSPADWNQALQDPLQWLGSTWRHYC